MDRVGADAYVYARACALRSKSWIGPRAKRLLESRRLQDLWTLIYDEPPPMVPEGLLALLLERQFEQRVVDQFLNLISVYEKPDPVSVAFLSLYEYNNLKAESAALAQGKTERPFIVDIGEYGLFNHDAWPDLAAITRGTNCAWYNAVPAPEAHIDWETRLDHEYYRNLWMAVKSLGSQDRAAVEPLVKEEIILQNIVWALRLRVYYDMDTDAIATMLALSDEAEGAALRRPASAALSRSPDVWSEWSDWEYRWLLNPGEEGTPWNLDPRYAQLQADRKLFRMAQNRFHRNPFTAGVPVAFFKLKQMEEQMVRVAAEGLRLGATADQIAEITGE